MTHRREDALEEVRRQNLLAAQCHGQVDLEDPEVMYVLESAVEGNSQRIYELSLARVIARLAEELTRMEAQIEEIRREREAEEPLVGAGALRR